VNGIAEMIIKTAASNAVQPVIRRKSSRRLTCPIITRRRKNNAPNAIKIIVAASAHHVEAFI
jgi:hypothetical protein